MTHQSPLHGKRGVPLLRCSTLEQADTSLPDQMTAIERFGKQHEMELLRAEELAGKSGSLCKNLEAFVDRIIARKQAGEPIDCIVYYDQSRFSRSGNLHFGHLAWKLQRAGIELAETDGYISDPTTASMMRVLKAEAAHRQAKSTAQASTRGSQSSLSHGRRAHCTRAPYGIDRLYKDSGGIPLYVIRALENGIRVKLDPETYAELERYTKGQVFRKERMHRVELIPGSKSAQQTVIRIFEMHFHDRMGGHSIAATLNDEGLRGPSGGRWAPSQILATLDNPVYLGWSWANFHYQAIYYIGTPEGPIEAKGQDGERKRGIRPAEDWIKVHYEALGEYLPDCLRPLAERRVEAHFERLKEGRARTPGGNRIHGGNNGLTSGLLSGILKEANTDEHMKLTTQARGKYLYYRIRSKAVYPSRRALRDIPARPLDRAVLTEIERLLCTVTDLKDQIATELRRQQRERQEGRFEIESIDERLTRARRRHTSLLRHLGGPDDAAVEEAIEEAKTEISVLTERLQSLGGRELSDEEIHDLTGNVFEQLSSLIDSLYENRDASLRRIAELLVDEAVVDAATRQARFRFAVPASLIADSELGLEGGLELKSTFRTNKWQPIRLSQISLTLPERCNSHCHRRFKPKGCGHCRRKPKKHLESGFSEKI